MVDRGEDPQRLDSYAILDTIGKGSFGVAYLAQRKKDGKFFVIKQIAVSEMSEDERRDAMNEIHVLSVLKHPNVIGYHESFIAQGKLSIVMDYADGGDLFQKIQRASGYFPEEQILDWFMQITIALRHVHSKNILHRDLKSQNIFLTRKNIVKLGDFGIAKVLCNKTDMAKTVIGTPYYLSPELCEDKPYNQKSDVWALGCLLYEMTTQKHAFEGQNLPALVLKITRGTYPPIPAHYSQDLRHLIDCMLQRNPEDRPSVDQILALPLLRERIVAFVRALKQSRLTSLEGGDRPMTSMSFAEFGKRISPLPAGEETGSPSDGDWFSEKEAELREIEEQLHPGESPHPKQQGQERGRNDARLADILKNLPEPRARVGRLAAAPGGDSIPESRAGVQGSSDSSAADLPGARGARGLGRPAMPGKRSGSNPAVGGRRKSGAGGRSGSSAAARRDAEILAQLHQQDPVQEKHDKIMQQREARKSRMEQERLKKLKNANEVREVRDRAREVRAAHGAFDKAAENIKRDRDMFKNAEKHQTRVDAEEEAQKRMEMARKKARAQEKELQDLKRGAKSRIREFKKQAILQQQQQQQQQQQSSPFGEDGIEILVGKMGPRSAASSSSETDSGSNSSASVPKAVSQQEFGDVGRVAQPAAISRRRHVEINLGHRTPTEERSNADGTPDHRRRSLSTPASGRDAHRAPISSRHRKVTGNELTPEQQRAIKEKYRRESSALRAAMRKDRMNSKPKNSDLQVEIVLPENMRFMVEAEMAREREEAHRAAAAVEDSNPVQRKRSALNEWKLEVPMGRSPSTSSLSSDISSSTSQAQRPQGLTGGVSGPTPVGESTHSRDLYLREMDRKISGVEDRLRHHVSSQGAPLLRGSSSDEVLRDPPSRADRFKLLGGGSSYARGSVDLDSEDLEELEDLSDEEEFDDSDEAEAEAEAERDLDDMMSEMESALSRNSTDGGAMVLSPPSSFTRQRREEVTEKVARLQKECEEVLGYDRFAQLYQYMRDAPSQEDGYVTEDRLMAILNHDASLFPHVRRVNQLIYLEEQAFSQ